MKGPLTRNIDLYAILKPETSLENQLLQDTDFLAGLFWGVPRFGHPEGEIYKHIKEVLQNIDCLDISAEDRKRLRIIAFVHDTFKYLEDKRRPRDWSKHHSIYARKFTERYTNDQILLDIIELHDEAYYSWRLQFLQKDIPSGTLRLNALLDRLGPSIQLYYLFFKCDTQTGDKNQAPLQWFESKVPGIQVVCPPEK